jgi:outer membrane receptor protein involved in Fe transport
VINIMTAPPSRRTVEVRTQYGSLNSPKFDVVASDVWGRLGVVVNASAFDTEGYATVAESERGLVDTKAAVDFRNVNVKLQYDASDRIRAFFRAGYFDENRDNGKITTIDRVPEANDTTWKSFSGGTNVRLLDGSEVQATIFSDVETFHSNFMAVPGATPARSVGRMTLRQTVPTTGVGGAVQWSKAVGAAHALSAGFDWRWVKGESQEEGLDATTGTNVILDRRSGGRQQSSGLFVQDVIAMHPDLTLTLSARVDRWRNYDGHNLEVNMPSGAPTGNNVASLPDRDDTVVSPRVAALYRVSDRTSVWGSIGSGFRAPTLNELYRQFQVGTIRTLPNHQLGPERLKGGELGVRFSPARQLTLRATWFDNRMEDAVSNITTGMLGALEIRQRQNVGLTRIAGVQTDAEYALATSWRIAGGYLYNRATVKEFAANPALVGNTLPQVPRHRGSVEVTYSHPRFATIGLLVQAHGRQFDDDRNTQTIPGRTTPGLPAYAVVSVNVARALGRNLDVFLGAQNLFDQTYYVGMLPTTVGAPRMINAGLRVRLTGN